jgi:hypothetical protein
MKPILIAGVVALLLGGLAAPATAVDTEGRVALGFSNSDAPVGGRLWVAENVGIDAGIGVRTRNDTENVDFAFAAGVPITVLDTQDRVNFNVRPGIVYENIDGFGSSFAISGQLEFEVFATNDFSVRASHGLAVVITSPDEGDSSTDFTTTGGNVTTVGFFFYVK